MAATVQIILSEPQEFYVPGDAILGRVIVTSLKPFYLLTELFVELWCEEHYNTTRLGEYSRRSLIVPAKENFITLLEQRKTNLYGPLEFGFTIVLDHRNTPLYPPSFSPTDLSGGVAWKVVAKAHLEKKCFTLNSQNVLETHLIEFHPDAIIHPRVHNLTGPSSRRLDLCHCTIGCYLPQRPAKFIIRLRFDAPQEVECRLKLRLQRKIVLKGNLKAELINEHMTLAEGFKVKISETSEPIELSCQLKKREPCAFSSHVFLVRYKVTINITGDHFNWYGETCVDLVPPSPESRLSSNQFSLVEEKTQSEPPPMYSK